MEPSDRTYNLLATVIAGLGMFVAAAVFASYALSPALLQNSGASLSAAILGLIIAGYYGSLHQLLKKKFLNQSTIVLVGLAAATVIVTVAQTGGLDSSYFVFWLPIIIIAGAFGTIVTAILIAVTVVYFVVTFATHGFAQYYVTGHLGLLAVTILTGGLVEWVYWRDKRSSSQNTKVASLSGRLSEEQLKAQVLMSQMGEGVIVVDADRKIQLFNNAAQALTGWDEASAQGIDYNLVLNLKTLEDEMLSPTTDPFLQAWNQGKNLVIDNLVLNTKAGRKIQLNLSVSPIYDGERRISGGICLFRDISREKALERQRDEFVSTASHEMRTPVAAIEGYISLAMNGNVATIDDRAKGFLIKAHDAVQHLGELFRDLLNVTKAEEGQLHGQLVAVNVTELVQRAVEDMQFTATKKNLSLTFRAAGADVSDSRAIMPLFWVKADPERLREVVMNLIDNAIKFTPQGGIIISMGGDTKEVQVNVSDSGIGIEKEDIQHLFQKFYRIDNSATRTIGGTGLGLYLCRTVIEIFNGRIWASSQPGQGTTFSFSLPRLTDQELATLETVSPAPVETASNQFAMPLQSIATGNPDTTPITANPMASDPTTMPVAPISLPIPGQELTPPVAQ